MDPRFTVTKSIRFLAVVSLMTTLTACQKAKMSSVPKKAAQPQFNTGIVPGAVPGGARPIAPPAGTYTPGQQVQPIVTPPSTPSQPAAPGAVIPPRATPPTAAPPANSNPPPSIVSEPTVVPLPTRNTQVTPPPTRTTPASPAANTPVPVAAAPASPAPAAPGANTVSYPVPVNTTGGGTAIIVPQSAGLRGSVQVGGAQPVVTNLIGDAPVFTNGVRFQTPIVSTILTTCHGGEKCIDKGVVFSKECPAGQDCSFDKKDTKPTLVCPDIELPTKPMTNKLDVLFVVDTSASMGAERQEIARQMTKFIDELSLDVDYRIAVLLGHGPASKTSIVGELFTPPFLSETYGVILIDSLLVAARSQLSAEQRKANGRSEGLNGEALEKAARAQAASMAANRLAEMMRLVPNDPSDAQGEAGLLNLYTSVSDSKKLNEMKRRGFWRDDAAKTIVFVADENDVCFDYEEASLRAGRTIRGHYATEKDRIQERNAFESQDVCRSVANGKRLTPKHVYEAAVNASSLPVIFTGILYLNNESIPKRVNDKFAKDNEMGHGYLDVIGHGGGKAADLAQKDFGTMLAKFGDYSNFKMKFHDEFAMENVADVKDIDPSSVEVSIEDPTGKVQIFNGQNIRLEIKPENNSAKVKIAYETLAKFYASGKVIPGSKVIIRYRLKSGALQKPAAAAADNTAGAANPAAAGTAAAPGAATAAPVAAAATPDAALQANGSREKAAADAAAIAEKARQNQIREEAEELRKTYLQGGP